MSDASSRQSTKSPSPTAENIDNRRGPGAGCLIIPIGGTFFLLLIGFAFYKGISLSNALDTFTNPQPTTLRSEPLPPDAATKLDADIQQFATNLLEGNRSELRLNKDSINHLLATNDALKELRGQFRVHEITDDLIIADISYPINNLPWRRGHRFLVGQLMLKPYVEIDQPSRNESITHLAFQVMDIHVPNSEIPIWFRDHFATYHLFERYEQDPAFQPYIRQLSEAATTNGELILRSLPLIRK